MPSNLQIRDRRKWPRSAGRAWTTEQRERALRGNRYISTALVIAVGLLVGAGFLLSVVRL